MLEENYVSFEIAKLLKDKGFDIETYTYWDLTTMTKTPKIGIESVSRNWNYKWKPFSLPMSAPTLQMTMKWLREVHNLFVFPFPQMNTNKFWVEIYQLSDNQEWKNLYCETIDLEDYSSYEEACEAAIKYCLENLI